MQRSFTGVPHTATALTAVHQFANLFTHIVMRHIKSPCCNDMPCTHTHTHTGHSGSLLAPNRNSIKVRCIQPHRLGWKHTHTHTAARHRGERAGAVAYRCSVSHSSCWSYSEVSAQKDGEPRHSGIKNRMEHEVTLKASQPAAPQTAGPANSL